MNGIYVIYFAGIMGTGQAMFVLKDNDIAGTDSNGSTLDGTLTPCGSGMLKMDMNLGIAAGGTLVTGFINSSNNKIVHNITKTIPENFANGQMITIDIPDGPVNVIFRRLRDI